MIFPGMPAGLLPADWPAPPRGLAERGRRSPLTAVTVHGVMFVIRRGDLDLASVPDLAAGCEQAIRQRPRRMIVDLADVCHLDCASARLIAGLARGLPAGERPELRAPRPAVRRMLQLTAPGVSCDVTGLPDSVSPPVSSAARRILPVPGRDRRAGEAAARCRLRPSA